MAPANPTVTYRDIQGFPGYRVGDDGSVWSQWRKGYTKRFEKWLPIKGRTDKDGYRVVCLRDPDHRQHHRRVSHLVLLAFVGLRPDGMEACHDDGDIADNRLRNLRWDTHKNNSADKWRHGTQTFGESHHRSKLSEAQARAILHAWRTECPRPYLRELAARHGVHLGTVHLIVTGKKWKHLHAAEGVA